MRIEDKQRQARLFILLYVSQKRKVLRYIVGTSERRKQALDRSPHCCMHHSPATAELRRPLLRFSASIVLLGEQAQFRKLAFLSMYT